MITDTQRKYYYYLKGMTGWFDTNLFDLIKSADSVNIEKLRLGFPDEVETYEQFKSNELTITDIEKELELEIVRFKVLMYKQEDENASN